VRSSVRTSRLVRLFVTPAFLAWITTYYIWFDKAYRDATAICLHGLLAGSVDIHLDSSLMQIWCATPHGQWYIGWNGTGYLIAAAAVTLIVAGIGGAIAGRRIRRAGRPQVPHES